MFSYHCHPKTREYEGRKTVARPDPLETKLRGKEIYLRPANSTFNEPPPTGANEAARMLDDLTWEIVPDFVGTRYWLPDGREVTIDHLNMTAPEDALNEAPEAPPLSEDEINEQKIQAKQVELLRTQAIESLKAENELPLDFVDKRKIIKS